MAGVYIHIPFCHSKCYYCDFFSAASQGSRSAIVDALRRELSLSRSFLSETVDTVYFGGGTPSLLDESELGNILHAVRENFPIGSTPEITLEANPDDLSLEKLTALKRVGFNRLSIGIQSFDDDSLKSIGRRHTTQSGIKAVRHAQAAGFTNITIDLIYGIPGQDDPLWRKNIDTALSLGVQHISAYALTVEEGTALHRMILKGDFPPVSDIDAGRQYEILVGELTRVGFDHYEISNFSLPGFASRHNSSYWNSTPYLGVGPSAHSYDGGNIRRRNLPNNAKYIRAINAGTSWYEQENLTEYDLYNEYVMTRLRTSAGIPLDELAAKFGHARTQNILRLAQKYTGDGHLCIEGGFLRLSEAGRFFADGIACDFFEIL